MPDRSGHRLVNSLNFSFIENAHSCLLCVVQRFKSALLQGKSRETGVFEMDVTEQVEAWVGGN